MNRHHTPEFRMSIDVAVTGAIDPVPIDLIQKALAEVTNRMAFGSKEETGRVLDMSFDHDDKRVTVDISYLDARRPKDLPF